MKHFTLLLVAGFIATLVYSQKSDVSLKLMNKKNEPVAFATFTITGRLDSGFVIKLTADKEGVIKTTLTTGQTYTVKITASEYKDVEKGIKINQPVQNFIFTTDAAYKALGDVVVNSVKAQVRQVDDKTVVDVESMAASSTNTFEVVERTPGLFVDQDGNVYLSSTTPAVIYINGRNTRMSAADMSSMLKSLPAGSISKVEIIRNPSTVYDASTSGGIVNIVLKKGVKIGLTGSVSAGLNQGNYGNQFAGFNLNNSKGRTTTYINTQVTARDNYTSLGFNRSLGADTLIRQQSYLRTPGRSIFAGAGITVELAKKWEFGADVRLTAGNTEIRNSSNSSIRRVSTPVLLSYINGITNDKGNNILFSTNATLKYKNDSTNTEWTTDVFYSHLGNELDQQYNSGYSVPASFNETGYGDNKSTNNLLVIQSDFRKKFAGGYQLEAGGKLSILKFNGDNDYFIYKNGVAAEDVKRTSTYSYRENIGAGYIQLTKNFSGIVIKSGLRLETTSMNGNVTVPSDTAFSVKRQDLFPYLFISRKLFSVGGYPVKAFLIYRKSITRPDYNLLNPLPRYVDPYFFEAGSPALRPQFTNNYEVNVSVEDMPIFAAGINRTNDLFSSVVYQADSNKSGAFRTYENIGTNREFYFRGTALIPPQGRFFFLVGAQYNHVTYEGFYESSPISFRRGTWTLFTNERYKIDDRSSAYFNAFVRFNGLQQFYELGKFGFVNFSVNRQFLKKKLMVTLSVSDVFFDNNYRFVLKQGSVNANGFRETDTRRVGINFRYNFGIRKKEEAPKFLDAVPAEAKQDAAN
jgi:iron complex outermembrane recepter protein